MGITKAKRVIKNQVCIFWSSFSLFCSLLEAGTNVCFSYPPVRLTYLVYTSMVSLGVISTVAHKAGLPLTSEWKQCHSAITF